MHYWVFELIKSAFLALFKAIFGVQRDAISKPTLKQRIQHLESNIDKYTTYAEELLREGIGVKEQAKTALKAKDKKKATLLVKRKVSKSNSLSLYLILY